MSSVADASKYMDDSWVCEVLDHMGTHVVRGQKGALVQQLHHTFLTVVGITSEAERSNEDSVLRNVGKKLLDLQPPPVGSSGSRRHSKRKTLPPIHNSIVAQHFIILQRHDKNLNNP